jgi:hypothetical protein
MGLSRSVCKPCWRPVIGGGAIGLATVLAYYVSGRGIGASGGITRLFATLQQWLLPQLGEHSTYLTGYVPRAGEPLESYLVSMLWGLLAGSFAAALFSGHLRLELLRGPGAGVPARLMTAFGGGLLSGFAARLSRGCTSGQAIVGGTQLSLGAWVFMICIFIGGFAAAWLVRRQWL